MKNTKWKKAIIGILVVTLIVATTMLLTGFSSAKEYFDESESRLWRYGCMAG